MQKKLIILALILSMVLAYMPSIVFATDAENNATVDPNSQNEEIQKQNVRNEDNQNKEQTQTLDQTEPSDDTNQFQIMAEDDEEDVDPGAESDYDDELEDDGYEEVDDVDEQEEDNSEYDDPDLVPDPATVKDNPPELPDKKGDAKLQKKYTKNGGDGNYTRLIKVEDFDPYGICCWDNKTCPPEGCKGHYAEITKNNCSNYAKIRRIMYYGAYMHLTGKDTGSFALGIHS